MGRNWARIVLLLGLLLGGCSSPETSGSTSSAPAPRERGNAEQTGQVEASREDFLKDTKASREKAKALRRTRTADRPLVKTDEREVLYSGDAASLPSDLSAETNVEIEHTMSEDGQGATVKVYRKK
jgi:hypothetical protein